MVNPVQSIGPRAAVEKVALDGVADRKGQTDAPAADPTAPARPTAEVSGTIVQFSDQVIVRQRGAVQGKARGGRQGRRLESPSDAQREAKWAGDAVKTSAALASRAQANTVADHVFNLLQD